MVSVTINTSTTVGVNLNVSEFAHITQLGSISVSGVAINSVANDATVMNAGSIFAQNNAVQLQGSNSIITNAGMISSIGTAILNLGFVTESQAPTNARVFNSGDIWSSD